jgi:uncharacterized protein (UPF0248 family)
MNVNVRLRQEAANQRKQTHAMIEEGRKLLIQAFKAAIASYEIVRIMKNHEEVVLKHQQLISEVLIQSTGYLLDS